MGFWIAGLLGLLIGELLEPFRNYDDKRYPGFGGRYWFSLLSLLVYSLLIYGAFAWLVWQSLTQPSGGEWRLVIYLAVLLFVTPSTYKEWKTVIRRTVTMYSRSQIK